MNATKYADASEINHEMLLVCDAAGRVQAASDATGSEGPPAAHFIEKHFSEVFGHDSKITEWLTGQMSEARKRDNYSAQSSVENGSATVDVRLDSLKRDGEFFGYAISLRPAIAPRSAQSLEEGDAVVVRGQWHEIKNQVGAMKLYATYLIRKMPESEDRQTIEKMLNGINGLIDYLAKIRRGEAQ